MADKIWETRRQRYGPSGLKPWDTWRACGHPRSEQTARKGRLSYGCGLCFETGKRPARFIDRIVASARAVPIDPHYAVNNRKLGVRVMRVLGEQEEADRIAYLLLTAHLMDPDDVAARLGSTAEELKARAEKVRRVIAATEHQNTHKDWPLVQQLIDEGIPEKEVQEMIRITPNGWFKAKQRGDVRV